MSELEPAPPLEESSPDWSPVFTASSELSSVFEQFNIDLEEVACLVEEEGSSREALSGLWIHFAGRPEDEPYLGGLPAVAVYIRKSLMQKPEYRKYIAHKIPQISEAGMSGHRFLVIDVHSLLSEACEYHEDPVQNIKGAFTHELLHFAKDMKEDGDRVRAELRNGTYSNSYALIDYDRAEERYVKGREQELMKMGSYPGIFSASLALGALSRIQCLMR